MLTRPELTEAIIKQINNIIEENPDWGRTRISKYLCELWDWRLPNGQLKDISCRDMLRALDKSGKILLPALIREPMSNISRNTEQMEHDTTAIACGLSQLQPLSVNIVEGVERLAEFKSLLAQYHYLSFNRTVGENMKYIVRSNSGAMLACLLFGSAAWSCRDRDAYIGWDRSKRSSRLQYLTNNTRFVVLPWVRVPCLASHVLALITKRLSDDWETVYGHGLLAVETFVECQRFKGTCYKAANWICVGRTTGRGRNDHQHAQALPIKDVYLLPLSHRWRENLLAE